MLSIVQKHILLLEYCKDGIVENVQELLDENDDIDICYDNGTYFYFAFDNAETDTRILNLLLNYAKKHHVDSDKLSDVLIDVEERVGSISSCVQDIIDQFRSDMENEVVDYEYSIAEAYNENNVTYLKNHPKDFAEFIKQNDKFKLAEKASINGHEEVISLMCELFSSKYTKAALYRKAAMASDDFDTAKKYLLKACEYNVGHCAGYKSLGELCDKHDKVLEAAKYFIQADIHNQQKNVYDKMYARLKAILATHSHDYNFIELAKIYVKQGKIHNAILKEQLVKISKYQCDTSTKNSDSTKQQFISQKSDDNTSQTALSTDALSKFNATMCDSASMSSSVRSNVYNFNELTIAEKNLLLAITEKKQHDFDATLEQFIAILEKQTNLGAKELLHLYDQDERHLEYLANDCYTMFLNNVPTADKNLCDFVIRNGYIKIEDIIDIRNSMDTEEQCAFDTRTNDEYNNSTNTIDSPVKSTLTANDLLEILNDTKDNHSYNNRVAQWIDNTTYSDVSNNLIQNGNSFSENLYFSSLARRDSLSDTISTTENTLPSEESASYNDDVLTQKNVQLQYKISSIEEAYSVLEKNLNNNNQKSVVASYINLGNACSMQGQFDFSILCYNKALEIVKKEYPKIPESTTVVMIYDNLGNSYMLKRELEKSMEYYNMAFNIKHRIYENQLNTLDVARSYDNIANIYKLKKDFEGAIEHLEKSLQIKMILYEGNKNNYEIANIYADAYHDLGDMHSNNGAINRAISFYELSIEIKEKIYQETKLRPDILLRQYLNLAYACKANGESDKAKLYYDKSTTIKESIDDTNLNNPHIMISIYHNLGLMHHEEKNLERAIEYYYKELQVKQQLYSKNLNHPDIAANYLILGNAYRDKCDLYKAIECYCQELDIKTKIYMQNPNHPDLIPSYHNLADAYSNAMMHNNAISCYQKALGIAKISCKNYSLLGNIYSNLAATYAKINNYDKAIDYCQKALNVAQNSHAKTQDNVLIALIYDDLGNIFASKGELQEAIKFHNKALKIKAQFSKIFKHSDIALTYNTLGNIYLEQEDIVEANHYYNRALKEAQKEVSTNILVAIHTSIGNMHARDGQNLQQALESYEKALEEAKRVYKDPHINLAKCYNNLGTIYQAKNEYSNSEKFYKQALKIVEKTHQPDLPHTNPNIALLCNNLGNLYNSMQQWDVSIQYLTKAYKIACHFYPPITELIKQNLVKSVNGFAVQKSFSPECSLRILTECLNSDFDFLDPKIQLYMSNKLYNNSDITSSEILQNISIIISGENDILKQDEVIELAGIE